MQNLQRFRRKTARSRKLVQNVMVQERFGVERNTPFGRVMTQAVCDVCSGTGKEITDKCTTCHGRGHVETDHLAAVTIPPGVDDGQQMRLNGQGEVGSNGGPYGDLYVVFQVEPSDIFDREGTEIHYTLPISFCPGSIG